MFETFLSYIPLNIQHVLSMICLHMHWTAHMACNFYYLFDSEGLLKVIASHIHCKCGIISEMVPDKSHCRYRPQIGSDIWQLHLPKL